MGCGFVPLFLPIQKHGQFPPSLLSTALVAPPSCPEGPGCCICASCMQLDKKNRTWLACRCGHAVAGRGLPSQAVQRRIVYLQPTLRPPCELFGAAQNIENSGKFAQFHVGAAITLPCSVNWVHSIISTANHDFPNELVKGDVRRGDVLQEWCNR